MNPKTTVILFAIAAALAAFVYFYEIKGEQARIEAEAAEKRLFPDVEQADITSISLRVSNAPEIRLVRREGHWRIVAPIDFAADTFAADGIASALTQLMSESVIEEPQAPEAYGLRAGGPEVRFTVGDLEKALRIGNATPVGSNSYASVEGDDRVFTVASYQFSPFKKEAEEFRDKRILSFDTASVTRVSIRWPEAAVVVERNDAGWQMVEPVEALADGDAIEGLLTNLSLLRASGFVDDPASEEETGFAPPQFEVEMDVSREAEAAGAAIVNFAVGGVDESGFQRFARGAAKSLYLISQESLDGFPRRVVEYRDRQLAKFEPEAARRIELGFHIEAGETIAVGVRLEEDGWVSNADPVRPERMEALVDALSDLRAHDIVAENLGPAELRAMKFDPPKVVLQVYGDGDSAERLAEIHLGVGFGDGVTARVLDRDVIFLLDAAIAAAMPEDLDDYRARFVAQPNSGADEPEANTEDADGGA